MSDYADGYRIWGWGDAADAPVPADLVALEDRTRAEPWEQSRDGGAGGLEQGEGERPGRGKEPAEGVEPGRAGPDDGDAAGIGANEVEAAEGQGTHGRGSGGAGVARPAR